MSNATAIAGVSPHKESVILSIWPSVGSTGIGRGIGLLCDCIPLRINGISVSAAIFALPLAPLAALIYLLLKAGGKKYTLTRKSIQCWSSIGQQLIKSVPLSEISEIRVEQQSGQAFYKAADIVLLGADGGIRMRVPGVTSPLTFQQNIQETQQAISETAASLEVIKKRNN
ncbi:MAG: hypothetical protein P8M30_13050 [Planctomycetaceae bacterium]|jgi:hypothetical protein|nr:hypothetical protein [Planctomycetaceae bacterium]MDG2390237.1 hypothetical protein [Planctomycetaceae bacterium]